MGKYICNFSGGKDSTAMLIYLLENNMPIDEIIFCDTGAEFPEIYGHLDDVENKLGVAITRLKPRKSWQYWMFRHIKTLGKHAGDKGYGFPNIRARWCSSRIKQDPRERYLKEGKNSNYIHYIGIAYGERRMMPFQQKANTILPLADARITEPQALSMCYDAGFTWQGFYDRFNRSGCWWCPFQSLANLKTLFIHYPLLWRKLRGMERYTMANFHGNCANKTLRTDCTIMQLERKFETEYQIKTFI